MATKPKMKAFSDILDTPSDQVARPKPTPRGTYMCMVKGLPQDLVSQRKQTPFSEYILQILEPATDDDGNNVDVDPEELSQFLTRADGEVTALSEKSLRVPFFNTPDALWRHVRFLDHLGIPREDEDGNIFTVRERMAQAPGKTVLAHVKHQASDDGETMYANVDSTSKVS